MNVEQPLSRRRWLLRAGAAAGWLAAGLSARAGAFTDFFRALQTDDVGEVRELLRQGFDPNAVDSHGNSALYLALQNHAMKVARVLIDQPGLRLDQRNPEGETALMIACLRGYRDLAEQLVARGAQVNPPGQAPAWSALSYAATNGHDELVKFLLAHGARVNQQAPNGTTPLMMAAYFGHASTVRLLLGAGADPKLRNAMGFTAMDLAMKQSHKDTADVLGRALGGGRKPGQW
jgi:ankyrin repeat protein